MHTIHTIHTSTGKTLGKDLALQRLLLRIIYYYQRFISPLYPPCCRFYPSCSIYTAEAIQSFGVITGTYIGLKRVCRCHPFCKGGFDPVPDQEE